MKKITFWGIFHEKDPKILIFFDPKSENLDFF